MLILGTGFGRSQEDAISPIQMAVDAFQAQGCDIAGIILNNAETEKVDSLKEELYRRFGYRGLLLSVIPYHPRLASPRMRDIAAQLQAEVLYGHQRLKNLATNRIVAAMQLQNSLHWLQPDSLVITPGDRGDIIAGMLQAHQSSSYPALAGILLSTGMQPHPAIAKLIDGIPDPPTHSLG